MTVAHRKISLVDGTSKVGLVSVDSYTWQVAVTTQPMEYTAEQSIGGLLAFPNMVTAGFSTGYLTDLQLIDKTDSQFQAILVLFNQNPVNSTIVDGQNLVLHPADVNKIVRTIAITPGEYVSVVGVALADVEIGRTFNVANGGTTLYGVLVLDQANVTFVGINDVVINLSCTRD